MKIEARIFSAAVLAAFAAGCAIWDAEYTENRPVSRYEIPGSFKTPITYNVHLSLDRHEDDLIGEPDSKGLRKKIEDALNETGLFSSVSYGSKEGADSYHIEFKFRQSGISAEEAEALGVLAGYTVGLVPVMDVVTFDSTAVLYLQGRPIYSIAKPEKQNCLLWLPLAPLGLFYNAWTCWHNIEKGSVNALCEAIAAQHVARFLHDAPVSKLPPPGR